MSGETIEEDEYKTLEDWKIFNNYDRIQQVETKNKNIILKEYNPIIQNYIKTDFEKTFFENLKESNPDYLEAIIKVAKEMGQPIHRQTAKKYHRTTTVCNATTTSTSCILLIMSDIQLLFLSYFYRIAPLFFLHPLRNIRNFASEIKRIHGHFKSE